MSDATQIQTARALRKSVGVTAVMLPPLLVLQDGVPASISATYYGPGRDSMIGALAIVSAFLLAYTWAEWRGRYAGRVAAVGAFLVGACPTAPAIGATAREQVIGGMHGTAALLFFGALAFMAWRVFTIGATPTRALFYRGCSVIIVGGILASIFCIITGSASNVVFWAEAVSIWAFGAAWFSTGKQAA